MDNPLHLSFSERVEAAKFIFQNAQIDLSKEYWTCLKHNLKLNSLGICAECNKALYFPEENPEAQKRQSELMKSEA